MTLINKKGIIVPVIEKKKKLPIWAKLIICIILVIVIAVIGTYLFINIQLNKINHQENIEIVPQTEEYFETDEKKDMAGNISGEMDDTSYSGEINETSDIKLSAEDKILHDKDVINILLIGQDRRPGESRARSDTMMIGTINKKNNTIKITSLMRDLYVQIPGYSNNRINAAYTFGGMNLLDETIEKNFQVHIDGNIEVDFDRFQKVINKIGEIEIFITAEEASYLTEKGFTGLSEGMVQMDGRLALEYSRIRNIGDSDFDRTERQKLVMITEFNSIKGLALPKILSLVDEVFPLVTTDLSNNQMISLATSVAMMGVDNIRTYRIPLNDAFLSSRIKGMSVLVPDLKKNRIALNDIIFGS